ncbi:hypothetical protein ABPG77_007578 [Micractinium sp. CCAP 211/92]
MDSDDDFDHEFFSAVDQLVAQHKSRSTQAPPAHQRGSQPPSPVQPPVARQQPGPGFRPQQHHLQQQVSGAPLQQINGNGGASNGGGQAFKPPPLPTGRQQQYPPPQQHGVRLGQPGAMSASGVPPGHVSMAAAELQSLAAAGPVQQPQWRGTAAGDPAAQLQQVQAELNRSQGQNKLLASTMQQKERELAVLRQKLAALERGGGGGGGPAGSSVAGSQQHRSTFAVAELQKQVDSLRQQLLFKDQEVDDIKRQLSASSEKQKAAEAAAAELQARLRQQASAAPAASAGQQQGGGMAAGATAAAQERPGSAGRTPSTSAGPALRSSGKKRRQSAGPSGASVAAAAATAGSTEVAEGSDPAEPAAATLPRPQRAPLLDPAVLAAASSLSSSTALVSQLMAACSSSMALLAGALPPGTPAAKPDAAARTAAPTALQLRSRLTAAAQAPDADSLHFVASFSHKVQQVACGTLPPAALLDSICSLVAASLAQLHAAASSAAMGSGPSPAASNGPSLPEHRLRLLAAGLHVTQHLIELNAGGAAAAAAGSSASGDLAVAPPRLSGRVTLLSSAGTAVQAPAAPAAGQAPLGGCWPALSSSGGSAGLPDTAALVQQHPAVFQGLASAETSALLPVTLGAALELGLQHQGIAAGALGTLLAMARVLQGEGARAVLAPVLSTGAMERFMQPPGLRLPALRLLQLLLEDASLARLFEASLSHAAAARCEPGPPTATAGDSDDTCTGGGAPRGPAAGGACDATQEGDRAGAAAGGPWTGAAEIAERLLDSFSLDLGTQPVVAAQHGDSRAAPGPAGTGEEAGGIASRAAVPRAAMSLVASLLEARQHGILIYLMLDDACGAPGGMLAERLVQLAESATAVPGEEGALMLLCPLPWPDGTGSRAASGVLLRQQAAWQQRLRVAQEALTLLRGLLLDESCAVAALDDLACIPSTARAALTTLSRLTRLEAPAAAGSAAAATAAGVTPPPADGSAAAAGAQAAAPPPPPALLAPWARAIGSSTDQAAISDPVTGSGAGGAPVAPGALPSCSVEDVAYMARGVRRRVLARMQNAAAMQQG